MKKTKKIFYRLKILRNSKRLLCFTQNVHIGQTEFKICPLFEGGSRKISFSPNFLRYLSNQIYLCPLLSIGQFITDFARGEAALRTEA